MRRLVFVVFAFVVALSIGRNSLADYSQSFDADDTANWTVNNNNLGTNAASFFFDYSTAGIPSAPHSGGTTRGLKLGANLDPATAPASSSSIPGISVSPTGQSFTGNYALRFDWWSNYIGPLTAGATGSTMLSEYGIMSSGTSANYPGVADGVWFAATGDGQSSADFRAYSPEKQSGYIVSASPPDSHATYAAGSTNQTAALYMSLFPAGATAPGSQASAPTQTGATAAGAAGFRWHDVYVSKAGNIITWSVDGTLLATVDSSFFTTGGSNILFGHADTNNTTNSSATNLQNLQFTLIDNVSVIEFVPEPGSALLGGLVCSLVGLAAAGRRFAQKRRNGRVE